MKKLSTLVTCCLIADGLSACGQAGDGSSRTSLDAIPAVDFTGTYTLNRNCNASSETLSISNTTISMNGVQCNIDKKIGINTARSEYRLSNCLSGDKQLPDRRITITEIEGGFVGVLVSGWGAKELTFQTCS